MINNEKVTGKTKSLRSHEYLRFINRASAFYAIQNEFYSIFLKRVFFSLFFEKESLSRNKVVPDPYKLLKLLKNMSILKN